MSKEMVKSYHDEYISNINSWEFLKNSYYGTGGFTDSGYLEKYEKESQQKYESRKKHAYYLNYCATVIDAYNSHLFKKPVIRKSKNQHYLRFIEDVDGGKKGIDTFMKEAFLYALIFGYAFVVVDKPDIKVETALEELEEKAYPYAYILPPQSVIDWSIDSKGEFYWVKVVEEIPIDAADFLHPKDKNIHYRIWTRNEHYLFNEREELVSRGEHGLGMVPFILLQNIKGPLGSIVGKSEIKDISRINKRLFNLCSELDDLLRSQTFATLTYPALDAKDLSDVELGTDRILTYDPSSNNAPAFISPSPFAARAYETRIKALIEEIYNLARINFRGGVSLSGIAMAFHFEKTNQALINKALNLQAAEQKIAEIVAKWQESGFEGEIQYPLDFSLVSIESEIRSAFEALNLDLSDSFNKEYKKTTARKLLPRLPESVKSIIDEEIQSGTITAGSRTVK